MPLPVEELFDAVAERLTAEANVDRAAMFGAIGLRTRRKFFAMLMNEDIAVKLPASRVEALLQSGEGRPFEARGRAMREWVRVRPPDEERCAALVEEARAFVASLTP